MTIQEIFDKSFDEFKSFCDERHNIYVNQFYDKGLTYSFHTDVVLLQGLKFLHLIPDLVDKFMAKCGLKGHDLIEDARLSYNDIKTIVIGILIKNGLDNHIKYSEVEKIGIDVAEIVFLVTDHKGRNRKERKPEKLYEDLVENKLAIFVKICDIIGNIKYGLLTNSDKFKMYKKEWYSKVRKILHNGTQKLIFPADDGSIYQELFDYLDKIFDLEG